MAKTSKNTKRRGPPQRRLDRFVGTWKTEGATRPGAEGGAAKVHAVDRYDWLPGGFFLLHRWDARIGGETSRGLEVIGYDAARRDYRTWTFDSQGAVGAMRWRVRGDVWRFASEAAGPDEAEGPRQRCTVTFAKDGGSMTARWEQASEGRSWRRWMDVRLIRVT